MQRRMISVPEIKLVGVSVRTSNQLEFNPVTSQISMTIEEFFSRNLDSIPNRVDTDTTFCVYTEYESDFNGPYTYFVGQEVESFDGSPEEFVRLVIPSQTYAKFTNGPGVMPTVCIEAWQEIWTMDQDNLGGTRRYAADFEVYDERAIDSSNTTVDIYIGINS